MTESAFNSLEIAPPPAVRRTEALRLACREVLPADRDRFIAQLLADAGADDHALDGLIAACRGGQMVGAIWAQVMPGCAAAVWFPQLVDGEAEATGEQLLSTAVDWLVQRRVRIAQVLLNETLGPRADLLRSAGFAHVADLLHMLALEKSFPQSRPQTELEFVAYSTSEHDRLARIVERTYVDALDCPALNGVRAIDDVLAGYRETGQYEPARWLFARHNGQDVGCLLLTAHPQSGQLEVVYMGLVPEARGHAWGLDLVRHAQWLARQASCTQLALAVDAANAPAIRAYRAAGMATIDERSVFLRVFDASP